MIERRALLKLGIGLGLGSGLGSTAGSAGTVSKTVPYWSESRTSDGQSEGKSARPKEGDLLIKAGDASKRALTPDDIPLGAMQTLAWAMDAADQTVRDGSRLNQLLMLRFDPETLTPETRSRAAQGVVAYTSICTHTGCDVDDWLADEQHILCACHHSMFDPKDGGKVIDGPAPRELPALPLKIVDGKLVVAKPFVTPVGFEKG
jgi:rieske iron-sulfur protein